MLKFNPNYLCNNHEIIALFADLVEDQAQTEHKSLLLKYFRFAN